MPSEVKHDPKLEALLDYLKKTRGFDFTGYKRSSLTRRTLKRMEVVGVKDFVDYMDFLEVHPEEFFHLFNTILINVTSFFRDEEAWKYLASHIIPSLIDAKQPTQSLRIWDAGCASGEEAYSIAMLLCEAMGVKEFQSRVKIYATDVDDDAIMQARAATYSEQSIEGIPQEMREKYFTSIGSKWMFHPDLRRCIIYGRHDLVLDAPISHVDLLICRNTLMYLNAETQARIIGRFHYAIEDHGFLFLGKAELLLSYSNLFQAVDMKYRFFKKLSKGSTKDRLLILTNHSDDGAENKPQLRVRELSFDASLVPQIVIDTNGIMILANQRARSMFGLTQMDAGRPLKDLELSYRPIELRSLIDKAQEEGKPVKVSRVQRAAPDGRIQVLDVEVAPLFTGSDDDKLGTSITFMDVTSYYKMHEELQKANQELETTNEELQSAHEELETTSEELQSTNEELETTNEELQSTNEELETMNEELQSTNEELETTNNELRSISSELNNTNSFLQSILASLGTAIVVVDTQFKIVIWTQQAQELWGLREEEVIGQSLCVGCVWVCVEKLKEPIKSFLKSRKKESEVRIDATNRRGKPIVCCIRLSLLDHSDDDEIKGVVLSMDEVSPAYK